MEKHKNSAIWTEAGYNLFAHEGLAGLQVERLARILQLNKSGFYHYFGDLEIFCQELSSLHVRKVHQFLQEVREAKKIDPDYLLLLVKYATTIMFQVKLTREMHRYSFNEVSSKVDGQIDFAVRQLWADFIGTHIHPDLTMRYYAIVRDMFYTRVNFSNFNYNFLSNLIAGAREIMSEITQRKALRTDKSFLLSVDDAV